MNNIEHILPEIVIFSNMPGEATVSSSFEDKVLDVADVASVERIEIIFGFLITKLGKRVYDDSENDVQTDDVDNDLESSIMHKLKEVFLCLIIEMHRLSDITNTTTVSESLIKLRNKTLKHGLTIVFSNNVRIVTIDVIIIHSVL